MAGPSRGAPVSARTILAAILGVLALVLAGCPEDVTEEPLDEPAADETPDEPVDDFDDEVALAQSCENEEIGLTVDYPEGWVVNEEGLPPCSAFDPEDVDIPDVGEIPTDIAIVIHENRVEFHRVTDFETDPGIEPLSVDETVIDGQDALVVELEHTGEGLYPDGWVSYAYYVDIDPFTLQASTFDHEEAGPPSYEERQEILDAMMASLEFTEAATDDG